MKYNKCMRNFKDFFFFLCMCLGWYYNDPCFNISGSNVFFFSTQDAVVWQDPENSREVLGLWRSHFHPTHLAKPPCHFQPFQGCTILKLSNSCFVPLQEFNFRSKLLDGSCCDGTFNACFQCVSANFRFF